MALKGLSRSLFVKREHSVLAAVYDSVQASEKRPNMNSPKSGLLGVNTFDFGWHHKGLYKDMLSSLKSLYCNLDKVILIALIFLHCK